MKLLLGFFFPSDVEEAGLIVHKYNKYTYSIIKEIVPSYESF